MTLAVEQTHSFVAWLLAHCHRNFDESTLSRAIFPSLLPFVFPCKKVHLEVRNQIVIVKHAEERHSRYGNCAISSCLDNGDAFFRMEKSTSTYSQATRHSDCVWQLKIEVVHKPDRVTGNTVVAVLESSNRDSASLINLSSHDPESKIRVPRVVVSGNVRLMCTRASQSGCCSIFVRIDRACWKRYTQSGRFWCLILPTLVS